MPDDSSSNGRIWQGLKALLFGEREASLRDQIEDAIDEHEEDGEEANGDLSPIERQMLRNLLHFGERTVGDVAVPRGDIIAVAEDIGFEALVRAFAEAGHSRLPVYRESLDTITGMIHIKDVFAYVGRPESFNLETILRRPLMDRTLPRLMNPRTVDRIIAKRLGIQKRP